jgi:hypothetical protein
VPSPVPGAASAAGAHAAGAAGAGEALLGVGGASPPPSLSLNAPTFDRAASGLSISTGGGSPVSGSSRTRRREQAFVIGVAGGTASGKTTVCNKIMHRLHDSCGARQGGWRDAGAEADVAAVIGGSSRVGRARAAAARAPRPLPPSNPPPPPTPQPSSSTRTASTAR